MTLSRTRLPNQFTGDAIAPFGARIPPRRSHEDLAAVPVEVARHLAREHRLLLLRGFLAPETKEDLAEYAKTWGELYIWPFGSVLELVEHDTPADHVFDSSRVSYHWDGMFKDVIPEFQIFQCVSSPAAAEGGRTIFCDTTQVLADADPETRALWERLELSYGIRQKVHYGGKVVSPLVVEHPDRGFPTMRYLDPINSDESYVNPPHVDFPDDLSPEQVAETTRTLRDTLYDSRHMYAHEWQPGDIVISDNHVNLHGREAYHSHCGRHLRRVHVLGNPPFANPALREE